MNNKPSNTFAFGIFGNGLGNGVGGHNSYLSVHSAFGCKGAPFNQGRYVVCEQQPKTPFIYEQRP